MAETAKPGAPNAGGVVPAAQDTRPDGTGRRARRFRIFAAVLVAAAVLGGAYWFWTRNSESTDDAFIEAAVIDVAPKIDGPVLAVSFTDNQRVAKGQVLLRIDSSVYQAVADGARAALAMAQAQAQAAEADLAVTRLSSGAAIDQARNALSEVRHQVAQARQQADAADADAIRAAADVKRYAALVKSENTSRQRFEAAVAEARSSEAKARSAHLGVTAVEAAAAQAQARLDDANAAPQRIRLKEAQLATARAQVQQAQAALRQAELNLSYCVVAAPEAGRVGRRAIEPGDVVQRGQTLTELVADPPWVIANFKETQITRMRPGQPVNIEVDAFPAAHFRGHVDSIQPGTGSRFALLPPENATGNYVKVVQRVPVKIVFDGGDAAVMNRLAPGMSVVPTVDVGARPHASSR